jgi:colicin import membrane protein
VLVRHAAARERQQREGAAISKAQADWIKRIQAKVRGNVIVPADIVGNPTAIFDVVQLPTGEIIETTLRKSSGNRTYDEAVQRAIIKSSPLPRPDRPELFQRVLRLEFRPQD